MNYEQYAHNQPTDGRRFALTGGYITGLVLEASAAGLMIGGASLGEVKVPALVGAGLLGLTELVRRVTAE